MTPSSRRWMIALALGALMFASCTEDQGQEPVVSRDPALKLEQG